MYWVISFGTPEKTYTNAIKNLHSDCIRLNIPQYMRSIDLAYVNRPGYYGAVLYKPIFIRETLYALQRPLMWVDADCRILKKIDLPEGDWDVGLIPHPMERNRVHFTPWIVSYMVFRPTEPSKQLLDIWAHLCQWPEYADIRERQETDHERFMWALAIMGDLIKVKNILPNIRDKIHMDSRHRKRNTFDYGRVPKELDDWYPEAIKLPQDKCTAIMEHLGAM